MNIEYGNLAIQYWWSVSLTLRIGATDCDGFDIHIAVSFGNISTLVIDISNFWKFPFILYFEKKKSLPLKGHEPFFKFI